MRKPPSFWQRYSNPEGLGEFVFLSCCLNKQSAFSLNLRPIWHVSWPCLSRAGGWRAPGFISEGSVWVFTAAVTAVLLPYVRQDRQRCLLEKPSLFHFFLLTNPWEHDVFISLFVIVLLWQCRIVSLCVLSHSCSWLTFAVLNPNLIWVITAGNFLSENKRNVHANWKHCWDPWEELIQVSNTQKDSSSCINTRSIHFTTSIQEIMF